MTAFWKDKIAIATVCADWRTIASRYDMPIELDQYCLAEKTDKPLCANVQAELRKDLQTYRATALHAPFNELFPAAVDPKARALAMERFRGAAALALELGVKRMVVHSGYIPFVYFKEWHIPRSVAFWTEFMADMPGDFELLIENVLDDEPYMLAEIVKTVHDPRVGVCYDVGHANVVSELGQDVWMDTLAPYLKHLHIHNNDASRDSHSGFAQGTVDIIRILEGVRALGRDDITLTAELIEDGGALEWLRERGYL